MAETPGPPSDRPTCTRTRRASVAAPDAWKAFKHKGAGANTGFQNGGGVVNERRAGGGGGGWGGGGAVHLRPIQRAGVSWGCCPLSADSTSGGGGTVRFRPGGGGGGLTGLYMYM